MIYQTFYCAEYEIMSIPIRKAHLRRKNERNISGKRMLVNIADIRQSYGDRKFSNGAHIPSELYISYSLTSENAGITLLHNYMNLAK